MWRAAPRHRGRAASCAPLGVPRGECPDADAEEGHPTDDPDREEADVAHFATALIVEWDFFLLSLLFGRRLGRAAPDGHGLVASPAVSEHKVAKPSGSLVFRCCGVQQQETKTKHKVKLVLKAEPNRPRERSGLELLELGDKGHALGRVHGVCRPGGR